MEKEVVLITGANGLLAKRFFELFSDVYSIRFLTRKRRMRNEFEWDIDKGFIDQNAFKNVTHIVHLAGAGIAKKRWTSRRRKEISSSRIDTASLILNILKKENIKIDSFISASAIGYYGTKTTDKIFYEDNKKGDDFLSDVCRGWEQIAHNFSKTKISKRTVIIRAGVILSKNGGVLKKMVLPIKYYIGSVLGKGNQYMPWIHIDDLCFIFKYLIDKKYLSGVFNAVSPEHINNEDFTKTLARVIKKPLYFPNIPSFIIKLIFGKYSVLILNGSRVSSKKIIKTGFTFQYSNLKKALSNLYKNE